MKLVLSTAAIFLLLNGAAAQTCPSADEMTEMQLADDSLTFKYAVVLASSADERSILCARLEGASESWLGFGISPTGEMEGGEGIIGLPDDGTVKKYYLGTSPRVDEMPDDKQTLMSASITQSGGVTTMEFAKYLEEDGEIEIVPYGDNTFLYAVGSGNELGYHAARGPFNVDFEMVDAPTPSSSTTGKHFRACPFEIRSSYFVSYVYLIPVLAPSPTTAGEDESDVLTRTLTPTESPPVPGAEPAPTEPTPSQPSGAKMMKTAGIMVFAGVAVCFGM